MTILRLCVLILGPLPLVAFSYAMSVPGADPQEVEFATRVAAADARSAKASTDERVILTEACSQALAELQPKLPANCRGIVRIPFVIAGDYTTEQLEKLHSQALVPMTQALWRAYFDRRPDQPIIIVVLHDDATYHDVAQRLDQHESTSYAGYYQRTERRMVLNLANGYGTVAHELSHALAQFDFPDMPVWFDEGLASLHEETVFSDDGLMLLGASNWRSKLLPQAVRSRQLPSLESVITRQTFRGEGEGLNYAQVRSFCCYLQQRGMLSHFYRKFRNSVQNDPSGINTLCELLGATSCEEVERDFHKWILALPGKSPT